MFIMFRYYVTLYFRDIIDLLKSAINTNVQCTLIILF